MDLYVFFILLYLLYMFRVQHQAVWSCNSTPLDTIYNLCLPQIAHTYGCTLQFVQLMMGANSTRNM
jgi:hypothetical protein